MSIEEVFLRDIQERPEDDLPRLLYADWLEDQPEPHLAARGELIRLQCESARLPADDPRAAEMEGCARRLVAEHQQSWAGPLAGLAERWEYSRGLVCGVTMTAAVFLDNAEAVFRLGPVRHLRLRQAASHVGQLAACPHLAPVTALDLRDGGIRWGLTELARSPHLGGLVELDLSRNPLGATGARALLEGAALPALKTLRLNGAGLGPAGLQAMTRARYVSPPGSEHHSLLDRITTLHLADNGLGPAGIEALWRALPASLVDLDLSRNGLGPGEAQELASGRWHLGPLQRLNLSGNVLGPVGVEALADRPVLDGLTALALSGNGIGDEGVAALAQRRYLRRRWTELALASNGIGPDGVAALLELPDLERLTRLDLEHNALGAPGAAALGSCPRLANLTDLELGRNRLGPAGVEELLAGAGGAPHLTRLRRLGLSGNGIGERGVRALLDAPHLDGLLLLDVSGNRLDADLVRRLRGRFGARVRA
jgi:uncharacterized protein (TIGR02996 family)